MKSEFWQPKVNRCIQCEQLEPLKNKDGSRVPDLMSCGKFGWEISKKLAQKQAVCKCTKEKRKYVKRHTNQRNLSSNFSPLFFHQWKKPRVIYSSSSFCFSSFLGFFSCVDLVFGMLSLLSSFCVTRRSISKNDTYTISSIRRGKP